LTALSYNEAHVGRSRQGPSRVTDSADITLRGGDLRRELPPSVRVVHLVALLSLALSIILLIAPAAIHRLSFGGRDDPRLQSIGSVLITTALLPLACAISCDVLIAITRLFGDTAASWSAALAVLLFLLGLWYILPLLIKRMLKRAACRE